MDSASPATCEAAEPTTDGSPRKPLFFGTLRCKHEWLAAELRRGNGGHSFDAHDRYRYRDRPAATGQAPP